MRKLLLVGSIATLVSACGQHEKTAGAPAAASTATSAPVATETVFQQGKPYAGADFVRSHVSFTVAPPVLGCDAAPGKGGVVTVSYDARPAGIRHARVWIQGANGKQSLWSQAPGWLAPQQTGAWMREASRVLVVDVDTGQLLAAQTVHAGKCP